MRYRSKPQEVEAIQWTGDLGAVESFGVEFRFRMEWSPSLKIKAGKDGAQDWVPVPVGHWIVRQPGDLTDHWPVDPSYFERKYSPVSHSEDTSARTHKKRIAELESDLAQCYKITGEDPDGNEDWRLATYAVDAVERLREESDGTTDALESCWTMLIEISEMLGVTPGIEVVPAVRELVDKAGGGEGQACKDVGICPKCLTCRRCYTHNDCQHCYAHEDCELDKGEA